MLPNIRPAHGIAVGVVLACALALAARYIATPLPLTPSADYLLASPPISSVGSIPAHVFAPHIDTDVPLPAEPPLSSFVDGAAPGVLLARQCLALAERDPLAAMEMAAANQLHEVDPGLAASLMSQWAAKDFARAYEWTKSQETGAWRDDMLARLSYVRAQADPIAAARLAVSDISAGRVQEEAVISVVHQWALKDARGAMRWVQSFPDEAMRRRASDEVAGIAASLSSSKPMR